MEWFKSGGHRYQVTGRDRRGGQPVSRVFLAPSPAVASVLARVNRISIDSIRCIDTPSFLSRPLRVAGAWLRGRGVGGRA